MGAWSVSITGNDTAQDMRMEYTAAFFRYDVATALEKIDAYVRAEGMDESDEEEWCDYYYSLADFMWKKGILTDEVRDQAVEMIDSGFGFDVWADSGEKTLAARKKVLGEFREKLLSPLPPKKRIKPNAYTERIFEDGDIIAIQLQTEGKSYTKTQVFSMSDEEFHSYHGKYILIQLVGCFADWTSAVAPDVKDLWATFILYDGIYDTIPEQVDTSQLKRGKLIGGFGFDSHFYCECSMYYFKKRKYRIVGHETLKEEDIRQTHNCSVFFGINRPHYNPDSVILESIGKETICCDYRGTRERLTELCYNIVCYKNKDYQLSDEENRHRFTEASQKLLQKLDRVIDAGGRLLSVEYGGRVVGFATICDNTVDHLCVEGIFRKSGFATTLLKYAADCVGRGAQVLAPAEFPEMAQIVTHICEKIGMEKRDETDEYIRYVYP